MFCKIVAWGDGDLFDFELENANEEIEKNASPDSEKGKEGADTIKPFVPSVNGGDITRYFIDFQCAGGRLEASELARRAAQQKEDSRNDSPMPIVPGSGDSGLDMDLDLSDSSRPSSRDPVQTVGFHLPGDKGPKTPDIDAELGSDYSGLADYLASVSVKCCRYAVHGGGKRPVNLGTASSGPPTRGHFSVIPGRSRKEEEAEIECGMFKIEMDGASLRLPRSKRAYWAACGWE